MTHIAEIVTPVYTCWTTLINIPHTCIFIHKIPLSSPPFSEDTDDETGQVLRGMDSLPPVLRRYVHADNCWFQQEISEWEEQFCQSQQVQQGQASQAGEPATAAASGPQEEETSPGSGPEAAQQTPVKWQPGTEEPTGSEPRLERRSEEKEEVAGEEEVVEEEEPARREAEEGWW